MAAAPIHFGGRFLFFHGGSKRWVRGQIIYNLPQGL
jgi:hypothetical protein